MTTTIDTKRGWRGEPHASRLHYADGRLAAEVYAVEVEGHYFPRYFRWRVWRPDGGEAHPWREDRLPPFPHPGFGTADAAQAAAETCLHAVGAEFPTAADAAVTVPAADEDVVP